MKSVFKIYGTYEIITAILILLAAIINVANAEDSRIIFSATATEKDVELLDPIKPDEVLPIILYEDETGKIIPNMYPVDLAEIEINNGRIWSSHETRFLTMPPRNPIFFCPNPNENENCLVPEPFEQPQALQCKREPTPVIKDGLLKGTCGPVDEGKVLVFQYEMCPPKAPYSYDYDISDIVIYSFCYDGLSSRNVFTSYRIQSAKLLSEKLLTRERELKFDQLSTETHGKIDLGYKMWLDSQAKLKPLYKLQHLASPKHMSFFTWKKPTNHFINVALQHGKLFDLWNNILDYIAADAAAMFASTRNVITAVIEIPKNELPSNMDHNQMYNIWSTFVADANLNPTRGTAILMNNFINTEKSDNLYIDKLCSEEADVCVESLKKMFSEVGGQVRCCLPTEKITSLLNSMNPIPIDRLLRISNINTV